MSKTTSIKKNFIMNALLTMSSFIFPLITFPYVSRILLPEGTGKVSFATSVISYFALFAQLGIPTYGIRACAQVRDDKEKLTRTVHELLAINLFMSIVAYLAFFIALYNVPRLRQDKVLFLIVSSSILFNAIGMEWLYKALEQYTYITIRSVVFKLIALIAMFLLVHQKSDYIVYGGISTVAAFASNTFNFVHARHYVYVRSVGHYNLKRHMRAIFVFFAMSCAVTIYTNLDTVMLGFMATDEDVGCYSAAVKIKSVLLGVVSSLGNVLLPRASYYVENQMMDDFYRITKKAINFVFLLSLPLMLYFVLFAREGIFFLSGNAYADAIVPMQIIMPTIVLIGLTGIMGIQMLVPLGKEKIVLYSEVAGAIADLILNAILIPRMASSGAAIGTLVAELVVWIIQFAFLRGEVMDAYRKIRYGLISLALVGGTVASLWVRFLSLGTFLTLVLTAILFFGVYGLILLLGKETLTCEITRQGFQKVNRILKGKSKEKIK